MLGHFRGRATDPEVDKTGNCTPIAKMIWSTLLICLRDTIRTHHLGGHDEGSGVLAKSSFPHPCFFIFFGLLAHQIVAAPRKLVGRNEKNIWQADDLGPIVLKNWNTGVYFFNGLVCKSQIIWCSAACVYMKQKRRRCFFPQVLLIFVTISIFGRRYSFIKALLSQIA